MNWKNAILVLALGFLIWLLIEKGRNADLARDFTRLRNSYDQTSDQLSEVRRQLNQETSRSAELDREARRLREAQSSAQREISSLKSAANIDREDRDKYRQDFEAVTKELSAARNRLTELEKLQKDMEDAPQPNLDYQNLIDAEAEARSRVEALSADLELARAENGTIRRELESATRELTAARSRIEELEKIIPMDTARPQTDPEEQASSGAGESETSLQPEDLSTPLNQAPAQMEPPEPNAPAEIIESSSRDEIEELRQELESSRRTQAELEAGLKTAQAEAAAVLKDAQEAAAVVTRLRDELSQASKTENTSRGEIEKLRQELESSRKAQAELEAGFKTAQAEAATVLKDAQDAAAAVTRLKGESSRASDAEREARKGLTDCQKLSTGQKTRIETLESELKQLKEDKSALKDNLSSVFVDRLLFNSGSVALSPAGQLALETAAKVINQSPDLAVLVVGHADDQAPNRLLSQRYPSNWDLSAARAAVVIRHLTEKGGVDPARLSLVGRSWQQPVAPNENDENRQQNRRVEIILSNHIQALTEANQ